MTLEVGQRMVRTDDGMRGTVELVAMPGFEDQYDEVRIVYYDRGEKRFAGKRETWEPVKAPSKRLRLEEVLRVAWAADQALRSIDLNEPDRWWRRDKTPEHVHDTALVEVITSYLMTRG